MIELKNVKFTTLALVIIASLLACTHKSNTRGNTTQYLPKVLTSQDAQSF